MRRDKAAALATAKKAFSRLGGFAVTALISGAVNVATIPLVVGSVGAQAWASIAAGQAVGIVGSIFVQLGWGVTGPAVIATTRDDVKRARIYLESLIYRGAMLPVIVLPVALTSWYVVPSEYSLAASVAGVGSVLLGLTASWYFVGRGDPASLLKLDTIPRVLATCAGAGMLLVYPSALLFSAAIVVSSILPLIFASITIWRTARRADSHKHLFGGWVRTRELIVEQTPGVVSSIVSQTYKYLPLIVISALRPDQAAAFALIDRIVKFGIAAVKPVSQSLQAWVPAGGEGLLASRAQKAMGIASLAALVACLTFLFVGPWVTGLLGTDAIQMSYWLLVPAALILGLSALTQTGLQSLLALRKGGAVAWAVTAAGIVGTALLWPAVLVFGAVGALSCLLIAESVFLILQLVIIRRTVRIAGSTLDAKNQVESLKSSNL